MAGHAQKETSIYRLRITCKQRVTRGEEGAFYLESRFEVIWPLVHQEVQQRSIFFNLFIGPSGCRRVTEPGGLMEFAEHIRTANVEGVVLHQPLHPPARGTLCVTGHHLLFLDREEGGCRQVLLLLRNIDAVEKR